LKNSIGGPVTADVLFLYRREIFMYETANFGSASNVYTYSLLPKPRRLAISNLHLWRHIT
jgi:hypothetical protein